MNEDMDIYWTLWPIYIFDKKKSSMNQMQIELDINKHDHQAAREFNHIILLLDCQWKKP